MSDGTENCGPDRSDYHTHSHPGDFEIDWVGYYDQFDRRTAALQLRAHHERNVPFGDSPFEVLDIYYPVDMSMKHPIVYFMHGGGQREGHPYHYGFIAEPFVEQGIIFISAGYKLAPAAYYPGNVESAIKGLTWVYNHIRERGGDPEAIHISGHSAGAWIGSNLAVRADWQADNGLPADLIKGAILLSGIYELSNLRTPNGDSYSPDVSPVNLVQRAPQHTVVAFGWPEERSRANTDNSIYGVTGFALGEAIEGVGGSVEVLALEHHDHAQVAAALGDTDSQVFKSALAVIAA